MEESTRSDSALSRMEWESEWYAVNRADSEGIESENRIELLDLPNLMDEHLIGENSPPPSSSSMNFCEFVRRTEDSLKLEY